ncbi:HNH endonuclease [Aneurinibacillus migulanus]|uniref:Uncharacterized protein n=1 Tax=Aneurinibacillus migulanus TaxID=47500 RepID=A0A0D1UUK4_ANEMI|nr:HNH endonuclease [Aneurinibacillus migulanus]KIV50654.1 hypothetical protein TS65_29625 [Aneurinibacillus migulanus]KON97465.1 hypothetical protein AF333_20330 [Aneurinibacillus migulanus]MCP1359017.1 HNH endonuclease [Aneurinibacillus migulanus]MED0896135.1 HNH endonuclease [Aneurinibacillus migulanus]MED1618563.1 HNH endonuclease [Aneurinibacillus migulanus]
MYQPMKMNEFLAYTENMEYAITVVDGQDVYLHNLIMKPPAGHAVIHLNKNGLDCRRENMKIVKIV